MELIINVALISYTGDAKVQIVFTLLQRDSNILVITPFNEVFSAVWAGGERRRTAASSVPPEERKHWIWLQPAQREVQTRPVHQSRGRQLSGRESRPQTAGQDRPGTHLFTSVGGESFA